MLYFSKKGLDNKKIWQSKETVIFAINSTRMMTTQYQYNLLVAFESEAAMRLAEVIANPVYVPNATTA